MHWGSVMRSFVVRSFVMDLRVVNWLVMHWRSVVRCFVMDLLMVRCFMVRNSLVVGHMRGLVMSNHWVRLMMDRLVLRKALNVMLYLVVGSGNMVRCFMVRLLVMDDGFVVLYSLVVRCGFMVHWSFVMDWNLVVNNGLGVMSSLVVRLGTVVRHRVGHMVGLLVVLWGGMGLVYLFVMGILHVVDRGVGVSH